ncbi:MAG: hypothetical protein FWC27_13245 [Firmicutes bacterium]|nr:hypothetical protein [Bacillota bacterium]
MTVHEFTPQLKKHINARLNDENTPVNVTGIPNEGDDMPCILISTGYALYKVPRPIYQMTFQTHLHREPPGPGEGFCMNGDRRIEVDRQLQLWDELKSSCQNAAHLTPYLREPFAGGAGNRAKLLRLVWADPLAIWIDTDVLNTVDVRWGEMKAAKTEKQPVYFQGTNIEAFFLPFCMPKNTLITQEAALAKAWYERKLAADPQEKRES